jgi:hypothetical protein
MSGRHRRTSHARPRHYQPRHREPQSRTAVLAPVGLAVAVVAGGAIAFGVSFGSGDGHAPSVGGGIVLTLPSPATPPPVPALLSSHSKQQQSGHHNQRRADRPHHLTPDTLSIRGTGPACYVEVTRRDGRVLVERVIHGHERLAYRQHNLDVVLGNAGAVRVAINGHRPHRAGRSGQVVRLHVG